MSKTDGLIWPTGDNGWKKIPTGPGYVSAVGASASPVALRCVKGAGAVAGAPGPIVDFTQPDQLETANPPRDGKPVVLWAGVHPTDLRTALVVWSSPVVILDRTKINQSGNISVNGRVMSIQLQTGVDIDGGSPENITIHSGAVGSYGTVTDSGAQPAGIVAADTANDTTDDATDKKSATDGQQIPAFFVNDDTTLNVICVYQFEMLPAMHCGGSRAHKAWGVSWCLWGSTTPMDLFPFGTFRDVDVTNLVPGTIKHYAGAVTGFADRSTVIPVSVVGTAGAAVTVQACLESGTALQDGEFVGFDDYECDTLCGHSSVTKVTRDEAIPFVDEDIIKPALRTLPLKFFTTAAAFTTATVPIITTSTFQPFTPTILAHSSVPLFTSSMLATLLTWNNPPPIPQGTTTVLSNVCSGNTPITVFGSSLTPIHTTVLSTVDLVVCLPGGGSTTLHLLALGSAGSVTVITSIETELASSPNNLDDITYFTPTTTGFTLQSVIETLPSGLTQLDVVLKSGATTLVLGTPIGPALPFSVGTGSTTTAFVPDPSGTLHLAAIVDTSSPTDDMIQVLTVTNAGKLKKTNTTVTAPGTCDKSATTVVTTDGGLYEAATEIVMLKPIIVQKDPGNEQACPCFTTTDGTPEAKPGDTTDGFSSSSDSYNPCTIKVRRLQHKRCLTSS